MNYGNTGSRFRDAIGRSARRGQEAEDLAWEQMQNYDPSAAMQEQVEAFDKSLMERWRAGAQDLVGEDVLITGAGPIGLMSVSIAKHIGARNIVITDINDYRLNLAREMGATRAINIKETSVEQCLKELNMVGFDIGMEMSGNKDAFESMLENMYHGGRIALLGILPRMTGIDWDQVIFKGLIIKGIYGREIFETWYKMETMLQSGLNISPVLTHRFNFDDFQQGFEVMESGNCGKVILELD